MILVTGANGFVGHRLAADLRAQGRIIRTVGRTPHSTDIVIDALDGRTNWSAALDGIDTVVHLAARVHMMKDSASDPLEAFRAVNRDGTLNLAREAAAAGVRRFVFISTLKVNGEETRPGHAFRADDTPHPEDAYAISKWEAEQGLAEIGRDTGMETVIIRPPLVYGLGVKANFAALHRLARTRLPLPFGRLEGRRSLLYVGNLSNLIAVCLDHPMAAGQTFLASDGEDVSVAELVRRIRRLEGRTSALLPVPSVLLHSAARILGREEMYQRLAGYLEADLSKTKALLNWTPPYTIDQGLTEMSG
ncbi:SDR family oxidoreductase [Rhizobium sp. CECT 9324]|uniref:UDP-glucose 4-epimerase family protein n=1 Tax=Rhizobium sp. CECT 9324 TaxID=2845820 RepID=UPI001E54069D|nr:SDR family oxidoreductase [Rhizobium sp. CECT 9324]CAH0341995.1 3 beta-hydroxysteroid dehydrogenase/Delta 5-->4-isomerase [Rhizobium sp. CECT 9324]